MGENQCCNAWGHKWDLRQYDRYPQSLLQLKLKKRLAILGLQIIMQPPMAR